jgi:drug/metabolite transporter (DMT)-like permease
MTRVAPALGDFGASALVYTLGLALAVPVAAACRVSLRLPPRSTWPLLLLTGVCETAGFVSVTFARRFAPMAVVAPVASLSAALTIGYAWLVLRERPRPLVRLGAVLVSAGMLILAL